MADVSKPADSADQQHKTRAASDQAAGGLSLPRPKNQSIIRFEHAASRRTTAVQTDRNRTHIRSFMLTIANHFDYGKDALGQAGAI